MTTSRSVPAPPFRIADLGLVLREWTDEDVPAMVALFDDPEVARWTPLADPFDADAAEQYLHRARESRAAGRKLQLAVTLDGGAALGEVMLTLRDEEGEVELGYAVGAPHRGQGLSVRSVRLLTDLAHGSLGVHRVLLRIDPGNAPSIGVARRAGFWPADEPLVLLREPSGAETLLRTWEHLRPEPN
jgi:RimJ/RimL family protein N-acetyltransferase